MKHNTDVDWWLSSEGSYTAFGDGSVTVQGALYGIVLIPSLALSQIESAVAAIKKTYRGDASFAIHCRELFHPMAKAKSPWSHLSSSDVVSLIGDILRAVKEHNPKYLVAYSPREFFPKTFRLLGKNGHPDLVHDVDESWITLNLYQKLAALLEPSVPDPPPDYKLVARQLTQPYWQVVAKKDALGPRVDNIFIDREENKIKWFSKTFKWATVARDLEHRAVI